jgi:hypothetical protein
VQNVIETTFEMMPETINSVRERISLPRPGVSLEVATELRAAHVREAVGFISSGLDKSKLQESFEAIYAPRWELDIGNSHSEEIMCNRASWNLICEWFLARYSGEIDESDGFAEAEEWFFSNIPLHVPPLSSLVAAESLIQARNMLLKVTVDDNFWDLFPYILQEFGPGSRSSIRRDPVNKVARAIKKHHGIFYTPSDVADYMVRGILETFPLDVAETRCFDPACGTGVYLLALLREAERRSKRNLFERFNYVTEHLFGCDISPHAVDACTFVLLQQCMTDIKRYDLSPWSAWHLIRLNLANMDSLRLTRRSLHVYSVPKLRKAQKTALLSSEHWIEPKREHFKSDENANCYSLFPVRGMIEIGNLFPESSEGFHILVGNPPYARLGERSDYDLLSKEYASFASGKARSQDNIFLPFVEMMWRLTVIGRNSSALVTPLSISYNSGSRFSECRREMISCGGYWKFAFFDREPHALFGEEVKTRNAILFRTEDSSTPQRGECAIIATGTLRKWTSRTRAQLFDDIRFTNLGTFDISYSIPKVEGSLQSFAFNVLSNAQERFWTFVRNIGRCTFEEALKHGDQNAIYVGGTAYNFLNVFRKFVGDKAPMTPFSQSPIHCLEFSTAQDASAAFAILSSRLVFWLWHIQSDGFHVPSGFLRNLPLAASNIPEKRMVQLSILGEQLWSSMQVHQFCSINGGRLTYTFRPLSCHSERDEIDSILVEFIGLPGEFTIELKNFERKIVVIDEDDVKRGHLKKYFSGGIRTCSEK